MKGWNAPFTPWNSDKHMGFWRKDEGWRVFMSTVSKKILIFDKYPYISKMLVYGTNVPWQEHQSALAEALLGHREL